MEPQDTMDSLPSPPADQFLQEPLWLQELAESPYQVLGTSRHFFSSSVFIIFINKSRSKHPETPVLSNFLFRLWL